MLGDSAVLGTGGGGASGDDAVAAPPAAASGGAHDGGGGVNGGGSNSGEDRVEEGDKSFGGNRWPRQETLALLKIRSDMDVAFRDATVKGPLWEEVSRKLAEHGYHRNAKKCKEKFENVYKYHKRTKEGRSGKSEGKTYRFFDQLQALENHPSIHAISIQSPTPTLSKPPPPLPLPATPVSIVVTTTTIPTTTPSSTMPLPQTTTVPNNTTTVPSTTTTLPLPQASILNITPPSTYFPTQTPNPTTTTNNNIITPPSFPNFPTDLLSNSSSSSTSSEETTTMEGGGAMRRNKRKRKWKDFFERLMKEVIEKQEELQRRFLEAIEKREQERVVREEAWRMQEMQRINREREILAQERSIAAAKDAAVMAFLQKIAEHQQQEINLDPALNNVNSITVAPTPTPQQTQITATVPEAPQQVQALVPQPQPQPQQQQQQQIVVSSVVGINKADNNNGENLMMGGASSSRWPKVEVQALINLRTNLETKYQENGPKGPLWEEISALMRKMGYNRNAKRCKEKWENINKYFKKVKESNKKRPQDSKTCPYFHQLEALYKEKNKGEGQLMKPESMMAPLMVQPEQQWPPQTHVVPPEVTMEDAQDDPMDQLHHEDDEEEEDDKDIGDEDEDEDYEGGGNYEIVASKPASAEAATTGGE